MVENIAVQRDVRARERIIAAARNLFATRGFHQTAVADLAKEAQISVGAIYRSFESKADIVHAIILADTERTLAGLDELCDALAHGRVTIEQGLENLILAQFSGKTDALSHEILAEAHRNTAVSCTIGVFCGRYRDVLGRIARFANPDLPHEEMEGAEELLLACLFGFAHRNLAKPLLDNEATARIAAKLLLQSLRAG
ncbi:MAG: helix-turn-helix domain-containing protein [Sphingobium sp.]